MLEHLTGLFGNYIYWFTQEFVKSIFVLFAVRSNMSKRLYIHSPEVVCHIGCRRSWDQNVTLWDPKYAMDKFYANMVTPVNRKYQESFFYL